MSLASFTHPSLAQIADLPPPVCARYNFEQQEDVIILGKLPNAPYVVIVPLNGDADSNADVLSEVQQCVADSFQAESGLGKYIQAGAFARRSAAQQLTQHLYSLGLDARTIYSP
ncbi:MAG: hypothetical protein KME11_09880 [Timaviella obliquedivisa GSE-PSE-MK23-08B]|nr:hypothetical protein [Timaviella obliquedivisa GSE-PSE-MK23-08B]